MQAALHSASNLQHTELTFSEVVGTQKRPGVRTGIELAVFEAARESVREIGPWMKT
jgi:hypothetical protein